MRIEIDITKSLEENATAYYDRSKTAKKKIEGAKNMVEKAERKLEEEDFEEESERVRIRLHGRKKAWYEKYRWCKTTNDYVVVGGRDASSNEAVIKKHAETGDLVFHTEAPGSPFVVLKNGADADEEDKEEAAMFAATYSQAWKHGLSSTEVLMVTPDQVSKEAKAGEYISTGSFMIYGEREQRSVALSLSLGLARFDDDVVLLSGPKPAVHHHCETYVDLTPGNKSKGDIAKIIMKHLHLTRTEDILQGLPSGEFRVTNVKTTDFSEL